MNLQWFADALASVVGILPKTQGARDGGLVDIVFYIKNKYVI